MTSIEKMAVVAVAIIAIAGWVLPNVGSFAGTTNYDDLAVDSITVSGASVLTGNVTFDTSTLFINATNNRVGVGTTTPATLFEVVESNATSTVYVRNASTTATTGARIILEDTDGAGCTQVTVLDGTVIGATVTCP